ncbi:hypothetical protein CORC01_06616 [Colletotrichum orchidophilum]|uniref:Uncharacterized protein n=1 Tax=Colletotrichum orchidophilum TaxID=1209926 RepID=A0A1G4B9Y2_9PEZI|nr:uncharacterized protein CORC01_06616 [Colletotrichum orchidophilum]OHE98102.1 hypothetical protein CORC01_06616 [Colletotrichum orchidophilum]
MPAPDHSSHHFSDASDMASSSPDEVFTTLGCSAPSISPNISREALRGRQILRFLKHLKTQNTDESKRVLEIITEAEIAKAQGYSVLFPQRSNEEEWPSSWLIGKHQHFLTYLHGHFAKSATPPKPLRSPKKTTPKKQARTTTDTAIDKGTKKSQIELDQPHAVPLSQLSPTRMGSEDGECTVQEVADLGSIQISSTASRQAQPLPSSSRFPPHISAQGSGNVPGSWPFGIETEGESSTTVQKDQGRSIFETIARPGPRLSPEYYAWAKARGQRKRASMEMLAATLSLRDVQAQGRIAGPEVDDRVSNADRHLRQAELALVQTLDDFKHSLQHESQTGSTSR